MPQLPVIMRVMKSVTIFAAAIFLIGLLPVHAQEAATIALNAAYHFEQGDAKSPCIGLKPLSSGNKSESSSEMNWEKPEQVVFPNRIYCAVLNTQHGAITIELYPRVAPQNVNSFVFLARQGYYNGITFHRVIANFMAQTGDPTGTGRGNPGYTVPLEVDPSLKYDREGRVGMARTLDPNSAGGQFFITLVPTPHLDPRDAAGGEGYTIIGQVVDGFAALQAIRIRNADQVSNLPAGDDLLSVEIIELATL